MPMTASFEELIKAIHQEMECEDVNVKPVLQYKMEKTGTAVKLAMEKDWVGMKAHVKSLGKKDAVICNIVVDKPVSHIFADKGHAKLIAL